MKNLLPLVVMLAATVAVAQQPTLKGNSPELTAQMNGQMAKRNTAVFEENKGQMKDQHWQPRPDVLFNGSAQGMHYYIRDNGMSYQLSRVESWKEEYADRFDMPGREKRQVPDEMGTYRVDVEWTDFNADFTVEKGKKLDGYTNYYNVPEGVEPALFVKQYESVTLKGLWPGIDLRCYSTEGTLETDWLVAPGADYSQIRFEVKGAELSTDGEGHLIMSTPFGEIREGGLKVFQEGKQLEARWVITPLEGEVPGGVVSFEVMGHDPMLAMRIDPVVRVWGTYYGGEHSDEGRSCATDGNGNVYLAGFTVSSNAIASNGHQNTFGGSRDAFLVKFNSNGGRLWATYYGGNDNDFGNSCITDNSDHVFLAGHTYSSATIASGGYQDTLRGQSDAFLVKFNSSGVRQWATYYGGSSGDYSTSCAVDSEGDVFLAGATQSNASIAEDGHQETYGGGTEDAFLVKFSSTGVRQWATYYGGSGTDVGGSCTTDRSGNVYLAGFTGSTSAIVSDGHQNIYGGGEWDAFLVKFNGSGVHQWSTYYGGGSDDFGYSCTTDGNDNVYLAGSTESTSAIASAGHQETYGGNRDAYLVKFSSNGARQWGTFYGGSGADGANAVATDGSSNVYMTGWTNSSTAIASEGHQDTIGSPFFGSAFLVKFNASGVRQSATYYGGHYGCVGYSCATDSNGNVYLAGYTESLTGIASQGHQNTHGGGAEFRYDAYLVKFDGIGTGLNDIDLMESSNTVFPNPGNGFFTLVTSAEGLVRITVKDISGREVLHESYTATLGAAHSIDISNEANGIYTLRIETEKGTSGVKLVKE